MESWKDKSQFAELMAETTTFPTAPPSPTPDHKPRLPSKEDVEPSLSRMLQHLQKLLPSQLDLRGLEEVEPDMMPHMLFRVAVVLQLLLQNMNSLL